MIELPGIKKYIADLIENAFTGEICIVFESGAITHIIEDKKEPGNPGHILDNTGFSGLLDRLHRTRFYGKLFIVVKAGKLHQNNLRKTIKHL